jgi:hypothetical protein
MQSVEFTQMKDGTQAEYVFLQKLEHDYIRALPDRLLVALGRLGESLQGYKVSRLRPMVQTSRSLWPLWCTTWVTSWRRKITRSLPQAFSNPTCVLK